VLLGLLWIYVHISGVTPILERNWKAMNDPMLVRPKAERCYIYAEQDELVAWRDIEEHAHEAEKEGWVVSTEKFERSGHVGHMRADPQRYWNTVARLLKAAS
jgi:hypothetical protein